jgi:hypothetical protein
VGDPGALSGVRALGREGVFSGEADEGENEMKICKGCAENLAKGKYGRGTFIVSETIEIVDYHELYCMVTINIIIGGKDDEAE